MSAIVGAATAMIAASTISTAKKRAAAINSLRSTPARAGRTRFEVLVVHPEGVECGVECGEVILSSL